MCGRQLKRLNFNFPSTNGSTQVSMKTKVAVYIQNCGDGSSAVRFFNSEDDAESYASDDGERHCEDIYTVELEFDSKGELLNPDTRE